jgi:putative nucleotide binding protein
MSSTESGGDDIVAAVLDVLPHGRSDDERPQHQKDPLAYALGIDEFYIYELSLSDDDDIAFGDRIDLTEFGRMTEVEFEDIPSGARQELEYAVEEIVEADEQRFVDFYNDAQPITLRLHQLNLLPGIGKKLRNTILDERKRKPFESFEDLQERVSGLHNPKEVLIDRIEEELRDDDLKYRLFVRRSEQGEDG